MNVFGKVHVVTDIVSGESSNGQPWEKQTVVIEEQTSGKPHYVVVEFMGENKTAVTKTLKKGDFVVANFYIVCTEYTNPQTGVTSWFTKLDGSKIDKLKVDTPPTE